MRRTATTDDSLESGRTYAHILRVNLFNFFNLTLFAVGAILVIFGRYNDALITVSAGGVGTIINTWQEIRAKRQLEQITLLVRPTAQVVRDGREQTVDAAHLVEGDLIHLHAGDQALVDGVVTGNGVAEMDEALLTGESELVRKGEGDRLFSGSFCVSGDLHYRADAVGAESYAGQLTAAARTFTPTSTPLQQQVAFIIRLLMILTAFMALIFYIGGFIRDLNFLQNVEASAVLIGLIPYGLFLTINLAYVLGAIKLARAGAVVQQTNAVESLHYVDVLCMDKTGTLTTNSLQMDDLAPLGAATLDDARRLLGDFAHSTSDDNATILAIRQELPGVQHCLADEVRFASVRKWSGLAFAEEGEQGIFALGAPEVLLPNLSSEFDGPTLQQQIAEWSDQGLRVLLFARNQETTVLHNGQGAALPLLQPLGLIGLRDELRPYAGDILQQFAELGVQIKIISGDSPQTVAALARQTALHGARGFTGAELERMSPAEFEQAAEEGAIFGRITPEQKARLVTALRHHGHYVAMIGDGVNDILALKKAQLGIAMQSGSSATRNVADMVLLNDSYAALAPALAAGKQVINGITNATLLLLARAFTYAFAIIGVLMVGLPFPFEPAQAGITAITVGLPSFFLTLWARPQAKVEPLLAALVRFVLPVALWSMLIGVALYTFVYFRTSAALTNPFIPPEVIARFEHYTGLTYQVDQHFGLTATRILTQTALSVFLSLNGLALILFLEPPTSWLASWRSVSEDRRPTWLTIALVGLLIVSLYVPFIANYLGFMPPFPPIWRDILVSLALWILGLHLFWRKRWFDRLLMVTAKNEGEGADGQGADGLLPKDSEYTPPPDYGG